MWSHSFRDRDEEAVEVEVAVPAELALQLISINEKPSMPSASPPASAKAPVEEPTDNARTIGRVAL